MVPYCASKHAAVGLSEGMRIELLRDNIYVTTVYPGLMRPDDQLSAKFKGEDKIEYPWFSILKKLPIASVSCEKAAEEIVEACRHGKSGLIISLPAQIMTKAQGLFPEVVSEVLSLSNFFIPRKRVNENGAKAITMAKAVRENQSIMASSAVTATPDNGHTNY